MKKQEDLQSKLLDVIEAKKGNKTEEVKIEEPTKEEEAKVEEKVEEKEVLSNTEKKEEVVEKVEEKPVIDKPEESLDVWKLMSEKLGRDVTSKEDLIIEKEIEKIIEKETEYGSEFSKAYDKFFKETGRSPQDYLSANRDLSTLSKDQVVRESLRAENPTLDQNQLDFLYNRRYGIDETEMSEDDITLNKIQFEQDYNKGLKGMEAIQKNYSIPADNSIASQEAQKQEVLKQQEQQQKVWEGLVETTNSEMSALDIKGEGFEYSHPIDATSKKAIKEIASDMTGEKWMQRYQQKDGSVDVKTLQEDFYIRDNFNSLLSEAFNQGKATQKEVEIKSDKHIDFKGGEKPAQGKVFSKKLAAGLDLVKLNNPKLYAELVKNNKI